METELDWHLDEHMCACRGTGWTLYNSHNMSCPIHFDGQLHPDTHALLLDEPDKLQLETERSKLRYKINRSHEAIAELKRGLQLEQEYAFKLELQLTNNTPTIRAMKAVKLELVDLSSDDAANDCDDESL